MFKYCRDLYRKFGFLSGLLLAKLYTTRTVCIIMFFPVFAQSIALHRANGVFLKFNPVEQKYDGEKQFKTNAGKLRLCVLSQSPYGFTPTFGR